MDPHVDDVPYEQLRLFLQPFELNDGGRRKGKYVRPGALPGGGDIKTYDAGNLFVTTVNNGSTAELGELRVRYRVRLEVPVLESTGAAPANNQVALFQSVTGGETLTTTVATNLVLAGVGLPNGVTAVNTAGSIVLPAGNYLIDYFVNATDTSNEELTLAVFPAVAAVQVGIANVYPAITTGGIAGGEDSTAAGSGFISVNGSQALTLVCTLTGAAGTLKAYGSMRIVAV